MSVQDIKDRVEKIREIAAGRNGGPFAHAAEDDLLAEVLAFIAEHDPRNASELATEALKSLDLKFDRWFE